eukprot:5623639-Pyramimonas_sp.AAC.1
MVRSCISSRVGYARGNLLLILNSMMAAAQAAHESSNVVPTIGLGISSTPIVDRTPPRAGQMTARWCVGGGDGGSFLKISDEGHLPIPAVGRRV